MERVILFSKAPRLDGVKTRMAPRLSAAEALVLYEAMLQDQVEFVKALRGPDRECEVCLDRLFAPTEGLSQALADLPQTLQADGDLGARMERALARAFRDGVQRAAIVGADAPTLPRDLLERAFAKLGDGADAVIIPAHDGGYVLVGASRLVPGIFEGVPWGTPSVADATRRLAAGRGIVLAETAPWPDVDLATDLPRLADELAADPARAPATVQALTRLGLYGPQNPVV